MVELPDAAPDESPHDIRAVAPFGEHHRNMATEEIHAGTASTTSSMR